MVVKRRFSRPEKLTFHTKFGGLASPPFGIRDDLPVKDICRKLTPLAAARYVFDHYTQFCGPGLDMVTLPARWFRGFSPEDDYSFDRAYDYQPKYDCLIVGWMYSTSMLMGNHAARYSMAHSHSWIMTGTGYVAKGLPIVRSLGRMPVGLEPRIRGCQPLEDTVYHRTFEHSLAHFDDWTKARESMYHAFCDYHGYKLVIPARETITYPHLKGGDNE